MLKTIFCVMRETTVIEFEYIKSAWNWVRWQEIGCTLSSTRSPSFFLYFIKAKCFFFKRIWVAESLAWQRYLWFCQPSPKGCSDLFYPTLWR